MTRGSKGCRTERKERARQRLRSRRYGRRGGGAVLRRMNDGRKAGVN